jgi:hypothetical protein
MCDTRVRTYVCSPRTSDVRTYGRSDVRVNVGTLCGSAQLVQTFRGIKFWGECVVICIEGANIPPRTIHANPPTRLIRTHMPTPRALCRDSAESHVPARDT